MDIKSVLRLNKHNLGLIAHICDLQDNINKFNISIHKKSFKYENINDLIDDALICLVNDLVEDLISSKAEYVDYFGISPIGAELPFDFDTVECKAPTEENTSYSE